MKYSKKYVLSLLFCLLSIVTFTTVGSDSSDKFVLKNIPADSIFHPYFIGNHNIFLVSLIKARLLELPIVNNITTDSQALLRYTVLAMKVIERYAQKNKYFPLTECANPGCLLTRFDPEENSRSMSSKVFADSFLSYDKKNKLKNNNIRRIISNAACGLLMEYELMYRIYNVKRNISINDQNDAQKIEFYLIDPFFQYINQQQNIPFSQNNKAFTMPNVLFVNNIFSSINNCSGYKMAKLIIEIFIVMRSIDKLIESAKTNLDFNLNVYIYCSIDDFIEQNRNNKKRFPLCYTVDLTNVLPNIDLYFKDPYQKLCKFLDNRRIATQDECIIYFLDQFDKVRLLHKEMSKD